MEKRRRSRLHTYTLVGMLSIDGDAIKQVNDTLSHADGDKAIKDTGRIATAGLRSHDLIARVGGDEFWAALYSRRRRGWLSHLPSNRRQSEHTPTQAVEAVIDRIGEQSESFLDDHPRLGEIGFGVSVGGAAIEDPHLTSAEVLVRIKQADRAMYAAKCERYAERNVQPR